MESLEVMVNYIDMPDTALAQFKAARDQRASYQARPELQSNPALVDVLEMCVQNSPRTEEESAALLQTFFDKVYPIVSLIGGFHWFQEQLQLFREYTFVGNGIDLRSLPVDLSKLFDFYAVFFAVLVAAMRARPEARGEASRDIVKYHSTFSKLQTYALRRDTSMGETLLVGRILIQMTAIYPQKDEFLSLVMDVREMRFPLELFRIPSDNSFLFFCGLRGELSNLGSTVALLYRADDRFLIRASAQFLPELETRDGQDTINLSHVAFNVRLKYSEMVFDLLSRGTLDVPGQFINDEAEGHEIKVVKEMKHMLLEKSAMLDEIERNQLPPTPGDVVLIKYLRRFSSNYVDRLLIWRRVVILLQKYSLEGLSQSLLPALWEFSTGELDRWNGLVVLSLGRLTPEERKIPVDAADLRVDGGEEYMIPLAMRTLAEFCRLYKSEEYDWTVEQVFPALPLEVLFYAVGRRFEAQVLYKSEWDLIRSAIEPALALLNSERFLREEKNREMASMFAAVWRYLSKRVDKAEFFSLGRVRIVSLPSLDQGTRLELEREFEQFCVQRFDAEISREGLRICDEGFLESMMLHLRYRTVVGEL